MLHRGLISVFDLRSATPEEARDMQPAEPNDKKNNLCSHGFRRRRLGEGSNMHNASADNVSQILAFELKKPRLGV